MYRQAVHHEKTATRRMHKVLWPSFCQEEQHEKTKTGIPADIFSVFSHRHCGHGLHHDLFPSGNNGPRGQDADPVWGRDHPLFWVRSDPFPHPEKW